MSIVTTGLGPHCAPPESMRVLFKKYQKASRAEIIDDLSIIDIDSNAETSKQSVKVAWTIDSGRIMRAFEPLYEPGTMGFGESHRLATQSDALVYEVRILPGLFILPSLLSKPLQLELLNRLLHRHLTNPRHRTNLSLHYHMTRQLAGAYLNGEPRSLFTADPQARFQPKDPHVHKEMSLQRMLEKKLRWLTLGGQYEWTAKKYLQEQTPPFPSDVAGVLKTLFPKTEPQAAILNFYSPGDTLSVHRDVSEECDRDLISMSFGCDGIFIVGNQDGSRTATIRLRSGDALLMSASSRYAWHAVPKVLAGTCPDWLQDWPVREQFEPEMEKWKGWMAGKRLNLNVRQIKEPGIELDEV